MLGIILELEPRCRQIWCWFVHITLSWNLSSSDSFEVPKSALWVVSPCRNLCPSKECARALCWGVTVECNVFFCEDSEWINLRWMDKWIRYYIEIVVTTSFILQIITRKKANWKLLSSTKKYQNNIYSWPERLVWMYSYHCYIRPAAYVIYDFGFSNHDHDVRKMPHSVKH